MFWIYYACLKLLCIYLSSVCKITVILNKFLYDATSSICCEHGAQLESRITPWSFDNILWLWTCQLFAPEAGMRVALNPPVSTLPYQ